MEETKLESKPVEPKYEVLTETECEVEWSKLVPPTEEEEKELSMEEILKALPGLTEEVAVIIEAERRGFNKEQMDEVVEYCREIAKQRNERYENGFRGREDPYEEVIPWDEIESMYKGKPEELNEQDTDIPQQ